MNVFLSTFSTLTKVSIPDRFILQSDDVKKEIKTVIKVTINKFFFILLVMGALTFTTEKTSLIT